MDVLGERGGDARAGFFGDPGPAFEIFAQQDYRAFANQGRVETIEGVTLHQKGQAVEVAALATNASLVAGAVLGVTTGVVALFVDWDGDGEMR